MSLVRQALILVTLSFIGTGCDGSTGPFVEARAEASLIVQLDALAATVTQHESVTWMRFTIPFAIHNEGPAAVRLPSCTGTRIEADAGHAWEYVWSPLCFLALEAEGEVVAPGQTKEGEMEIYAVLSGPGGPEWRSETTDGSYRLVMWLTPEGSLRGNPVEEASNPFALVMEP